MYILQQQCDTKLQWQLDKNHCLDLCCLYENSTGRHKAIIYRLSQWKIHHKTLITLTQLL